MAIGRRFAAFMMAVLYAGADHAQPVVRDPAGKVRGVEEEGKRVFKGIPYALGPVGERRWKPPVAVPVWPPAVTVLIGFSGSPSPPAVLLLY